MIPPSYLIIQISVPTFCNKPDSVFQSDPPVIQTPVISLTAYIYISIYRVVYLQYKLESVFNSRPGFAGWPTIKILLLCVVCFFQDRISRGGKKTGAAGRSECRAAARREPRGRPDVHRVGERRVRGSESISAEAYS